MKGLMGFLLFVITLLDSERKLPPLKEHLAGTFFAYLLAFGIFAAIVLSAPMVLKEVTPEETKSAMLFFGIITSAYYLLSTVVSILYYSFPREGE